MSTVAATNQEQIQGSAGTKALSVAGRSEVIIWHEAAGVTILYIGLNFGKIFKSCLIGKICQLPLEMFSEKLFRNGLKIWHSKFDFLKKIEI